MNYEEKIENLGAVPRQENPRRNQTELQVIFIDGTILRTFCKKSDEDKTAKTIKASLYGVSAVNIITSK